MKKMNKKELFEKYNNFLKVKGIGDGWLNHIKSYIPVKDWIATASIYQIAIWAIGIKWLPYWVLIVILIIKFYLGLFVNWWAGKKVIKIGLQEAQLKAEVREEYLTPYQKEIKKTVENIAQKVGANVEKL